ncbi:2OG-Fe dioxygenase family protein [Streptomyces iranensis]|uniref:Uncharacterized protein n=1 Tax=Streptomyces iranensis TaxID=576784 RepID=A0A061ACP4_9ACTN|nr:predicted protein [Streptomyces iranensis]
MKELAHEWEHLETDRYLKNGSRFRGRAYDRFFFLPRAGELRLRPHQPYFQSESANDYAGGIRREVAALSRSTLRNPLLTRLLRSNFARFPVADSRLDEPWDVRPIRPQDAGRPAVRDVLIMGYKYSPGLRSPARSGP